MAEIDRHKAALIAEIEISRGELRSAIRRVENSADLVERARKGITKNLSSWLIGASIAGFIFSQILARGTRHTHKGTPKPQTAKNLLSSGMALSLGKMAFDLARPALLHWATSRFFPQRAEDETSPPT